MSEALTKKQQAILDFIRDFRRTNRKSPTIREIGEHFGIKSPNGVVCHIRSLEKKGSVKWDKLQHRSIMPTDECDPRDAVIEQMLQALHAVWAFGSRGEDADGVSVSYLVEEALKSGRALKGGATCAG